MVLTNVFPHPCRSFLRQRIQTKILRIASGFGSYFTAVNGDDKTTNIFLFLQRPPRPHVPMSHQQHDYMVVGPKEDANVQVRPFKVIDFFGSHLTHATSQQLAPLGATSKKVGHPKTGSRIVQRLFLFCYHTTTFSSSSSSSSSALATTLFGFLCPLLIYMCVVVVINDDHRFFNCIVYCFNRPMYIMRDRR